MRYELEFYIDGIENKSHLTDVLSCSGGSLETVLKKLIKDYSEIDLNIVIWGEHGVKKGTLKLRKGMPPMFRENLKRTWRTVDARSGRIFV